jgi:hypothetical protein
MFVLRKPNQFWQSVGVQEAQFPPVEAESLEEAVKQVCLSNSPVYAFRRSRDLIDLKGNFRHLTYQDTDYIVKLATFKQAEIEVNHAIEAARRLSGTNLFEVVVPLVIPLSGQKCALVMKDMGVTLSEDYEDSVGIFPIDLWVQLLSLLLEKGVEFQGFLPRNLIWKKDEGRLCLLDWEDVFFHDVDRAWSITDMTVFKWHLAWSQMYGIDVKTFLENEFSSYLTNKKIAPLDSFERMYQLIINNSKNEREIREECANATYVSEEYHPEYANQLLYASEIGHLMDDLFPKSLSVFYTFATAKIAQQIGRGNYTKFISAMTNVLRRSLHNTYTPESISISLQPVRKALLTTLIACFSNIEVDSFIRLSQATNLTECIPILNKLLPYSYQQDKGEHILNLTKKLFWSQSFATGDHLIGLRKIVNEAINILK